MSTALDWTNRASQALWIACNLLALLAIAPKYDGVEWNKVDKISKDQANQLNEHWNAERAYWHRLDIPFLALVEQIPKDSDQALQDWGKTVQAATWEAYRRVEGLASTSPHTMKASVRAGGLLAGTLKKIFPEPEGAVNEKP